MPVTIGTFNLNNLFSRFNFSAVIDDLPASGGGLQIEFVDSAHYRVRSFMGKMVKGKAPADTLAIADRIKAIDVDVLAVQEVEHIEVLKAFNRDYLGGRYAHIALVEGNDSRFIDVGVMSKLPLGAITSYQTAVHPDFSNERVFSRDLLRVEVLNAQRSKKLFALYVSHLKSRFVAADEDQEASTERANLRRQCQAEMTARIISNTERADAPFILLGDMNDPPDSAFLRPQQSADNKPLFNALQNPKETRPAKAETEGNGPATTAWTYRHNPSGPTPPQYYLFDQIWLSDSLRSRFVESFIDRRTKHGGNGSDHDPAWVVLDLAQ